MAEVQKHKYDILVGALIQQPIPDGSTDPRDAPKMGTFWDEFHRIRFSVAASTFDEAEEFALLRLEQVLGAPRAAWRGKTWELRHVTLDGDVAIIEKPSGLVVPS